METESLSGDLVLLSFDTVRLTTCESSTQATPLSASRTTLVTLSMSGLWVSGSLKTLLGVDLGNCL